MPNSPVIRVRGLEFSYEAAPVLSDVNLDIEEDDFVCLVGPNGGGKTTLLKLLLGLLRPDRGTIAVLGESPDRARARVGYVPQYFQFDLNFPVRVLDVVLMGRLDRHPLFGRYTRADRQVAVAALDDVGMAELRLRPFAELSGGQRQRVLIARALACAPRLFLLDEPTANVDPAVQIELYDLLRELNKRLTIVMVSHDVGFVSSLVKRVVCVNRTVQVHPTSDITGEKIFDLYGAGMSLVHHDRQCAGERRP